MRKKPVPTHKNIGSLDRVVRVLAGAGLLYLIISMDSASRWAGLLGIYPLATAIIGICPLYTLTGIDTREVGSGV